MPRFEFHIYRDTALARDRARRLTAKKAAPADFNSCLRRGENQSVRSDCAAADSSLSRRESIVMKAKVTVTLKSGILDPQGKAIEGALRSLGITGVASVRQGKLFDIEIAEGDRAAAEAKLEEAAERLLANTVIENYDVKVID
jgi:phosphoribosylformylglycinamidine synthase subunit PurS